MPKPDLESIFPGLRGGAYDITSAIDPSYNCAAFAAHEQEEWWDPYRPDGVWPDDLERDASIGHFIALYERKGFVACVDGAFEIGFEKIALYADASGAFGHAARQLESGLWTSKLGELEDIQHASLESLANPDYGQPSRFMKRPRG